MYFDHFFIRASPTHTYVLLCNIWYVPTFFTFRFTYLYLTIETSHASCVDVRWLKFKNSFAIQSLVCLPNAHSLSISESNRHPFQTCMSVGFSDIAGMQRSWVRMTRVWVRRIAGFFTLLDSLFQASFWALNRRRGDAHKLDRQTERLVNTTQ